MVFEGLETVKLVKKGYKHLSGRFYCWYKDI